MAEEVIPCPDCERCGIVWDKDDIHHICNMCMGFGYVNKGDLNECN